MKTSQALISAGKIDEALTNMLHMPDLPSDLHDQLIVLSGEYAELSNHYRIGDIDLPTHALRMNSIAHRLLSLLRAAKDKLPQPASLQLKELEEALMVSQKSHSITQSGNQIGGNHVAVVGSRGPVNISISRRAWNWIVVLLMIFLLIYGLHLLGNLGIIGRGEIPASSPSPSTEIESSTPEHELPPMPVSGCFVRNNPYAQLVAQPELFAPKVLTTLSKMKIYEVTDTRAVRHLKDFYFFQIRDEELGLTGWILADGGQLESVNRDCYP
ncbi:MAG: hypothetical protein AAF587_00470 [Bacteroidota bacterium]